MPPRYAYWTIIVDDQATAFRAGSLEDIMPTFNRLKEKQPSAKLMWFQSGKLWPSRVDAREAMQMRGERGRDRDPRQVRPSNQPTWKPTSDVGRPAWKPKGDTARSAWKPKGESASGSRSSDQPGRPEWKPKSESASGSRSSDKPGRPEWKPKSESASGSRSSDKPGRPEWKPKSDAGSGYGRSDKSSRPAWKPKGSSPGRLDWKPKGSVSGVTAERDAPEGKRKWVPKAEYKKMTGTEAPRDQKWRPGGEHKDPRQKYIDAKKAKWTRVKQTIRTRAQKPRGKS